MADLIVLRGTIDAGKTTTCGFIYQDLLPICNQEHIFNGRTVRTESLRFTQNNTVIDFEAVLMLQNGKQVSIISAGDNLELRAKLNRHIARGSELIICCTRSQNRENSTFRMIQDEFQPTHPIVLEQWVPWSQNGNLRAIKAPVVNAVVNYIRSLI